MENRGPGCGALFVMHELALLIWWGGRRPTHAAWRWSASPGRLDHSRGRLRDTPVVSAPPSAESSNSILPLVEQLSLSMRAPALPGPRLPGRAAATTPHYGPLDDTHLQADDGGQRPG